MKVVRALGILALSAAAVTAGDAKEEKRDSRKVLQADSPFLEAYWESWTSWPYDYTSCFTQTENPSMKQKLLHIT